MQIKPRKRRAALDIVEDPAIDNLNARQTMLKFKEAHGSGQNLQFPEAEEVEANMHGFPADHKINIYGDGSLTSPTLWWAALGGYGAWVPKRNDGATSTTNREEASYFGPAIGENGTSTRM